jgi:hypothetical protein
MLMPQLGQWLRQAVRALRPWIDVRTSEPLVLLVVVAMAAFLGPPLCDTAVALVYNIPPGTRWTCGEGCLLLVVLTGFRRSPVRRADGPVCPRADARGRLELAIRPVGLRTGIVLHVFELAILVASSLIAAAAAFKRYCATTITS